MLVTSISVVEVLGRVCIIFLSDGWTYV
jgi:hypothetical protein